MITKGSLVETKRGMFRIIDTRTLLNPFTDTEEIEYIIEDNGVKRKLYDSDIIAEVKSCGMEAFKKFELSGNPLPTPDYCINHADALYSTDPNKLA